MPVAPMQTLKGFRDFLPADKRARDFVAQKIIQVFEKFGFEPLETPTLEYADLLLGKYGDEADKLVYTFEDRGGRDIALRYDQTVPSARVLAQYQSQLPRYFRRYQLQNVFRADKPQKGRYREFAQCDIDIFGSTSPLADAEIIACSYQVYQQIGFEEIEIRINDRQVLFETLQPLATDKVDVFSLIQSIDKLDKKTPEEVKTELVKKGLTAEATDQVLLKIKKADLSANLSEIVDICSQLGVPTEKLKFTPTLARGLDYYTGMIFEIILPQYGAGSCGGGGRYDQLINQLSGVDIPAVGVAYGFDRTVEAAQQLGLIPSAGIGTQILVTIFDDQYQDQACQIATQLRETGFKTELYPSAVDKLNKQLKTADQKQIPFVIIIGPEEAEADQVSLRDMKTGQQQLLTAAAAISRLKECL